jgi:drug/metabolite transporter (DMT)-like permease
VTAALLAALAALVWGTGDFCGGKASQRVAPLPVTVLSQLAGLVPLAVLLAFAGGGRPGVADAAWSVGAGMAGFLGILLLYRGLSMGAMAVFAPITAMTAAVVPLVVGLVFDRTPSTVALIGAGCAIVAIGLISAVPGGRGRASSAVVLLALASGAMFGAFFALLGQVHTGAGAWPLLGLRLGSLGLGLLVVARTGTSLRVTGTPLRLTLAAGVLDITANGLYLAAAVTGALSVVAPIAALYPVSTVLLALVVDRERVRTIQVAGLGLAAAALVLAAG